MGGTQTSNEIKMGDSERFRSSRRRMVRPCGSSDNTLSYDGPKAGMLERHRANFEALLVRDNGVRKTDEQAKKKSNDPSGPRGQLHATNDKTDGEATRKCAEQGCRFVGKRHRQHKTDVQRSEN